MIKWIKRLFSKRICKAKGHIRKSNTNNLDYKGQQDLICPRCGERYGYIRFVFRDKDIEDKYRDRRRKNGEYKQ